MEEEGEAARGSARCSFSQLAPLSEVRGGGQGPLAGWSA